MNRMFVVVTISAAALVGGFLFSGSYTQNEEASGSEVDHKDTEYFIEGQRVKLENGFAETGTSPDSASRIVTRYYGNQLDTDLDGDGRGDVAFILSQTRGGSGTFYYAVAALDTGRGYAGSEGYLLGDRVAPRATTVSPNPRHEGVVVFNYAERAPEEALTARPSVGKSVYLKLDPSSMRWGIVEADFAGESK